MRVSKVSKEQIVDHARREIFTHGFHAVRVEDIAAALGISKKTFYQHFESKESLVRAVALSTMTQLFAELDPMLAGDDHALEKISALIGTAARRFDALPRSAPAALQRHYPRVWNELMANRRAFLQRYVKVLAAGQRRGEVRRDFSAPALTAMVVAVVEAIGNPGFLQQSNLAFRDALRLIQALLVGGLSARAQEEQR